MYSNKVLPIIPWMGGKRRLAADIIPLFPEHKCYVELFFGGGAVFFMRTNPAPTEVINDINCELVNLYRIVQNHFDEFCRQFDYQIGSRSDFQRFLEMKPKTLTDIQRATRFFFLQHHAFGGKVDGQNFGYGTQGKSFDITSVKSKLQSAHKRLSGAYIENSEWYQCVERYDRPYTFFYADPPYWQTGGYGMDFPWSEFEKLENMMCQISGKMMLSINAHDDIKTLFSKFYQKELTLQYSLSRKKDVEESKELIVCNYEPTELQSNLF